MTAKQMQILNYIKLFTRMEGFPPTRLELCAAFSWKSPNAAQDHLMAMQKKGAILVRHDIPRGIKVLM
jgi:repressor LexA